MPTEREILLNLWKCGATIYQWNTYDPQRNDLVLRVYIPLDTPDDTE